MQYEKNKHFVIIFKNDIRKWYKNPFEFAIF